jgi:hypothetical protein
VGVVSTLIIGCNSQPVETGSPAASKQNTLPKGTRQPVLVELFTSEGCSSCPPADRNLAFLSTQQPVTNAEIITLAFHVDYWDRLGWKDRFSSPLFSERQESYTHALKLNSNYTPQMVVDGATEFVGSDSGKAAAAITKAIESEKATIDVLPDAGRFNVKIVNAPSHRDSTVYGAITEDGISTRVEGGENSGKMLEHVSVVRELKVLGELASDKSALEVPFDVTTGPEWKKGNLNFVVFVQENESKKVIGVGKAKVGGQ